MLFQLGDIGPDALHIDNQAGVPDTLSLHDEFPRARLNTAAERLGAKSSLTCPGHFTFVRIELVVLSMSSSSQDEPGQKKEILFHNYRMVG